jgi:hypothetical protein
MGDQSFQLFLSFFLKFIVDGPIKSGSLQKKQKIELWDVVHYPVN